MSLTTKTWAIVYGSFEGLHHWKDAPESEYFLRNLHRHLFTVEVWIEQKHNDRDIEYYNFKTKLKGWLDTIVKNVPNTSSCEMFCDYIQALISYNYPNRDLKITVKEDGFEGACVEYVQGK